MTVEVGYDELFRRSATENQELRHLLLEAVLILAKVSSGIRIERFEGIDEARSFVEGLESKLQGVEDAASVHDVGASDG